MKKIRLFTFGIVLLTYCLPGARISMAQSSMIADSVIMGASYPNEVYYSMANKTVATVSRDLWDIAFRPNIMSSSIIINDGKGVVLYTYPKADTNGWSTVDTTGLSGWTPMYNDPDDWENGAFSRNALGHPDYGWGIYNSTTHNLKGDSIFIIKLRNESFRKIWIVRKYSSLNTYVFKFAFLDGSNEQEITLDCSPYSTKDFVGYNLAMNVVNDFQPVKTSWDILFTKYMSVQPNGTPYPVVGVLTNDNAGASEFRNIDPDYTNWGVSTFDQGRSVIGYDWKVFDMGSFTYKTVDSLVYFVQDQAGDVYKLRFTRFDMTTGTAVFNTEKLSLAGIPETSDQKENLVVYPNPASDRISINLKNVDTPKVRISITDLLGKRLFEKETTAARPDFTYSLPLDNWKPGLYILTLTNGNFSSSQKMLVKK